MSAIPLNNRVTSYSDSDATFASCTVLPIHQKTLNYEEMAGIDGLWSWEEVVDTVGDYVSDVADTVGDHVSHAAAIAEVYIFGGIIIYSIEPPPVPPPNNELNIITAKPYVERVSPEPSSY